MRFKIKLLKMNCKDENHLYTIIISAQGNNMFYWLLTLLVGNQIEWPLTGIVDVSYKYSLYP
jgi:hypothetical protein